MSAQDTEVSVLERMLLPFAKSLSPELAEQIVHYQLDPETQARIDDLAERANQGSLSDAERSEYLQYVEAIDLISILQHKAEQVLERRNAS